jgi:hypothetical protein
LLFSCSLLSSMPKCQRWIIWISTMHNCFSIHQISYLSEKFNNLSLSNLYTLISDTIYLTSLYYKCYNSTHKYCSQMGDYMAFFLSESFLFKNWLILSKVVQWVTLHICVSATLMFLKIILIHSRQAPSWYAGHDT